MSLYHKKIYWEDWFDIQSEQLLKGNLTFSYHIHKQLNKDSKHAINFNELCNVINRLQICRCNPFEVEVKNNKVTKCCIRTYYDSINDIIVVFRKNKVITAWLNRRWDSHNTLNKNLYIKK